MTEEVNSRSLTDNNATESLPKQRRFAILMSMSVIGYYWFGLVAKDFSMQGADFEIANKKAALWALWLVWGWSVLRYCQRAYALLSDVKMDISIDVMAEDMRIALKKARRLAIRHFRSSADAAPDLPVLEIGDISMGPPGPYTRMFVIDAGGRKYRQISVGVTRYSIDRRKSAYSAQPMLMEWTRWQTIGHNISSWIAATIRLPALTEHVAPFLLAIAAAISPLYDSHKTVDTPPSEPKCIVSPPTTQFHCKVVS